MPHWALHIQEGELRTLCVQRRPLLVTAGRSSSASTEVMKALHCTLLSVISALWGSFNSVIEQNDPGDQWSVAPRGTVSKELKSKLLWHSGVSDSSFSQIAVYVILCYVNAVDQDMSQQLGLVRGSQSFLPHSFFSPSLLHAYLFYYCYHYYFVVFSLIKIRLNKEIQ